MRRVLVFYERLGEVEHRRPEGVFVGIGGQGCHGWGCP